MLKRWIALAICAATALTAAGCGGVRQNVTPAAPAVPTMPSAPPPSAEGEAGLAFEVIKESMLPAELVAWKELDQAPKTPPSAHIGDYIYVLVGEYPKPTGGYAIAVTRVDLLGQSQPTLRIQAVISGPKPGTVVTQVVTYPKSYIRVPYAASKPTPAVMVTLSTEAVAEVPPKAADAAPGNPTAPAAKPGEGVTNVVIVEKPPTPSQPQPSPLKVEPLEAAALPASLSGWRQSSLQVAGGTAAYEGDFLYVMVSGGEQRTGGYRVEVTGVQVSDGRVRVDAVLHKPAPGQMVTMALTYPKAYARVSAKGSGEPMVEVVWK